MPRWTAGRGLVRALEHRDLGHEGAEIGHGGTEQLDRPLPRRRPNEIPEPFDERQIRQPFALEVEACTMEDRGACRARPVDRIADEAGLADPRFATDQDDDRSAQRRALPGVVDPGQLAVAADRDRARPRHHVADGTTGRP